MRELCRAHAPRSPVAPRWRELFRTEPRCSAAALYLAAGARRGPDGRSSRGVFWERVVAIDLMGVVAVTDAFLAPMIERGRGGRIVNVAGDASPGAGYVTGQVLSVSGGLTMAG
ncbi:MAG TPA: SDR family NAD(P)-dependent oxidoreductase [Solirubrobacteraceae bacterium]|nr:SDR family NAD(P)-dependent oxidoreductase [Solirubrobacteraceae bacterium]